jgi:hypothetical protein
MGKVTILDTTPGKQIPNKRNRMENMHLTPAAANARSRRLSINEQDGNKQGTEVF